MTTHTADSPDDDDDDAKPRYEGPMYVTPGCCAEMEDWKPIVASLDIYCGDLDVKPVWYVGGHDLDNWRGRHTRRKAKYDWGFDPPPTPKCCPFCAKPVPKLIPRRVPLPMVCVCTDGGYYCDTCKERLSNCRCAPPVFAYEPAPA